MFDFDPFSKIDPFSSIGKIPGLDDGGAPRQRAAFRQPLDPAESESVGRKALNAGASGLQYVLGSIAKPQHAVTGLLAGQGPEALKNLIPFSDSLGITDPDKHVSGRDLLDMNGITDKGDKGWGAWGAGLAADIATDPLTFAGFGPMSSLTKAGKAAKAVGATKGLSREALLKGVGNGPLAGLAHVGVPFGPKAAIGTGEWAQPIARGLDQAGDFLRYKVPGAKTLGALFDHTRGGTPYEATQRGWEKYGHPAIQAGEAAARADVDKLLHMISPLIQKHGVANESLVTSGAHAVAEGGGEHLFPPNIMADVQGSGQYIKGLGQKWHGAEQAAGLQPSDLADPFVDYAHRQSLNVNHNSLQMGGRRGTESFYPTTSGSSIHRDELYRGVPGGQARIDDWYKRFAGTPAAASMQSIRQELEQDLTRHAMTPEIGKAFDDKALAMAERLEKAKPRYREEQLPFYSPDEAANVKQRAMQHARLVASAKAAAGTIADNAKPLVPGGDMVPVADALARLKMSDAGISQFLPGGIGGLGLTPEHAEQILKAHTKWSTPEEIKAPLKFFDSWTNAFKGLAYPMWIPSHVRNAFTAVTNNMRRGVGVGDYLDQLQEMTGRGSRDLSGIHPSLAGLGPAQQVEQLRSLKYGAGNVYGHAGMSDEVVGNVKDRVLRGIQNNQRFTPFVPGSDRSGKYGNVLADTADLVLNQGLLGSLKATGKAARDSLLGLFDKSRHWGQGIGENLGIKGVAGAEADLLPAVKAGRIGGTNVEDFFRGAQMNRELRGGLTPEMAAEQMNKLHFDYDALTSFEKSWMRRAVPFYTFARRNIPLQLETLATKPGVIANQYKPFYQGRNDQGYIPQYLASGAAVPIGEEQDGHRQYLSKFGLPAEEAFEKLHFRDGLPDIKNTVLDFMGTLNPIVKAPLEQLFDTQFHTQRKLSDLKAPQGASAIGKLFGDDNPQLLGQIVANSPMTRFFTSADKLLDERKGLGQKLLNLGTGVRVTDVDVDKQRAIETRAALERIMAGHPSLSQFTNFYVKPEDAAKLTPDEIQMMRKYTELQDASKLYAKSKREQIGIRP